VLATAKYALLPAKDRLRRCKTEQCATRLESFLSRVTKLSADDADATTLDALAERPGIDAGEAVMFAVAAYKSDSFIITGDKRALEALQIGQSLDGVREALASASFPRIAVPFMVEGDCAGASMCQKSPGVNRANEHLWCFGAGEPESVRAALKPMFASASPNRNAIALLRLVPDKHTKGDFTRATRLTDLTIRSSMEQELRSERQACCRLTYCTCSPSSTWPNAYL
jgi:hypothetical protein